MTKRFEDLTFTDDGMFQAVLHEPGICAELVERLLHIKVNRIDYPELENVAAGVKLPKNAGEKFPLLGI